MCQTRTFNYTRDVRVALSLHVDHEETASAAPIYSRLDNMRAPIAYLPLSDNQRLQCAYRLEACRRATMAGERIGRELALHGVPTAARAHRHPYT